MGDGPAYDYAYAEAEKAAKRRREARERRFYLLNEMLAGPGLGDNDRDASFLERQAAYKMKEAYEYLAVLHQLDQLADQVGGKGPK